MKKILSLFLSLVMLLSITAGMDFSAYADDVEYTTISTNGTWYEGYITNTNTTDYYKIALPSDGTLSVKIMHYMSMFFYLYNDDLSIKINDHWCGGGNQSSPETETLTYDLSKGIYYVKIQQANSITGKYKLNAQFNTFGNNEIEPNGYEQAMDLSPNKIVTGAITIQDDVDWYKITLSNSGKVTFKISHYTSMFFYLYNYDLSIKTDDHWCGGGNQSSPETETLTYDLSKGIYYVKIQQANSITGKYKLSWNMNVNVSKPNNFRVSSRNTSSLKLAWNKVSGVSGYQLQRKSGNSWKTITNTTATSCTVKSLKAGTAYTFRVRAYKTINGTKYYSGWRTLTTPTKPATVSLSSLKSGKKKFTAKWKKTACTGYQIQYSTSSKFKGAKTVTVGKNSTTSKTVSKLKAKKKYYVRVRAYKTVNGTKYYGAWSKTKTVKTKK